MGAVRLLVPCKTAYLLCRGDCQIVAAVEDMVCVLISNYLSVLSWVNLACFELVRVVRQVRGGRWEGGGGCV